jgi:TRAP transporter TAXI family solute receptor
MMQRFLRLVAILTAALLTTSCAGEGSRVAFLSIGTGGTGGIYYPLGGAIASILSAGDSSRQYTAEVTGGSVENIARIALGQIDLGFAIGTSARAAYDGDDTVAVADLRIVAPLYPNVAHVLVRDSAGIASVGDVRGRSVSVGSAGSGTEQFARHLLGAYGLDYEAIDERFLSFSESSAALRDGAVDAAIFSVGYPAAAVLEATTNAAVRLLPVEREDAERLRAGFPFYRVATIPAGAYNGLDSDLPTVSVMNWMVGLEGLDDGSVISLLDALRDDRAALVRVNEIARQIDLAALADAPIPLHPAAARWLEENR